MEEFAKRFARFKKKATTTILLESEKEQFLDFLDEKNLSTRQGILDAFQEAFENGNVGFHLCHPSFFADECILKYFHNLFEIEPPFFHVRLCQCERISLYIDPRKIDPPVNEGKYVYHPSNGNRYVRVCHTLRPRSTMDV